MFLSISIVCFRASNDSRSLPSTKQTLVHLHDSRLFRKARYSSFSSLQATQKKQQRSISENTTLLIEEINKSRNRVLFTNVPRCRCKWYNAKRWIGLELNRRSWKWMQKRGTRPFASVIECLFSLSIYELDTQSFFVHKERICHGF